MSDIMHILLHGTKLLKATQLLIHGVDMAASDNIHGVMRKANGDNAWAGVVFDMYNEQKRAEASLI